MKRIKWSVLVCLFFFASGCASVMKVEWVSPDLTPRMIDQSLKRTTVAVDPFVIGNMEQKSEVIGEAKVGFFNFSADIVPGESVGVIVAKGVADGFNKSGWIITKKEQADYIVTGIVDRFWVDEYATGLSLEYSKAAVRYDLIVKGRQGNTVWATTVESYKTSRTSLDATDDDIPTLAEALKESVESVFSNDGFWAAIRKSQENK
jgi:hypothetical protein